MKDIMNQIEKEFLSQLETKNSWGKNEIKELYTKVCEQVYLENLSSLMERKH